MTAMIVFIIVQALVLAEIFLKTASADTVLLYGIFGVLSCIFINTLKK